MLSTTHRIYTNDLERERLRQGAYATTANRLSLNRHRTRRAHARQLTVIALVAKERGDRTIYNECREMLGLEKGEKFETIVEVVESRRPSREKRLAFASNRVLGTQILDHEQHGFPLVQENAQSAAELDRLV